MLTAGAVTITAQLAPASYTSPQQVQTTLVGCVGCTGSPLDIALAPQNLSVAQGATVTFELTARVLSNGVPQSGQVVNFSLYHGTGTLNPASATTNSNGYASTTLQLSNFAARRMEMPAWDQGTILASACSIPCRYVVALRPSTGISKSTVAQPSRSRFGSRTRPRPDPVLGVSVLFQSLLGRTTNDAPIVSGGDPHYKDPMPIISGCRRPCNLTRTPCQQAMFWAFLGLGNFAPHGSPFTLIGSTADPAKSLKAGEMASDIYIDSFPCRDFLRRNSITL